MRIVTNKELLQQAHDILERSGRTGVFNREAEAKVNSLLRMAELCRAADLDSHTFGKAKSVEQLWNRHQMGISERTVDAAALRFFGGKRECGTGKPEHLGQRWTDRRALNTTTG